MKELYSIAGISKQALLKYRKRQEDATGIISQVLAQMDAIRADHERMGSRKVYYRTEGVPVGRDRFEAIALAHGYRVKRKARKKRTTWSQKVEVHPNRIEGLVLKSPDQVWQSDIFYLDIEGIPHYGVDIIDVYTRVMLALHISTTLKAKENVSSLDEAIAFREGRDLSGCIHHSDRGAQYISKVLKALLRQKGMVISMGEQAEENAYVERLHGILKEEYLLGHKMRKDRIRELEKEVQGLYNEERPHRSLAMRTPMEFEREVLNKPAEERPELVLHEGYARFRGSAKDPGQEENGC
jgi:putative transposase